MCSLVAPRICPTPCGDPCPLCHLTPFLRHIGEARIPEPSLQRSWQQLQEADLPSVSGVTVTSCRLMRRLPHSTATTSRGLTVWAAESRLGGEDSGNGRRQSGGSEGQRQQEPGVGGPLGLDRWAEGREHRLCFLRDAGLGVSHRGAHTGVGWGAWGAWFTSGSSQQPWVGFCSYPHFRDKLRQGRGEVSCAQLGSSGADWSGACLPRPPRVLQAGGGAAGQLRRGSLCPQPSRGRVSIALGSQSPPPA